MTVELEVYTAPSSHNNNNNLLNIFVKNNPSQNGLNDSIDNLFLGSNINDPDILWIVVFFRRILWHSPDSESLARRNTCLRYNSERMIFGMKRKLR